MIQRKLRNSTRGKLKGQIIKVYWINFMLFIIRIMEVLGLRRIVLFECCYGEYYQIRISFVIVLIFNLLIIFFGIDFSKIQINNFQYNNKSILQAIQQQIMASQAQQFQLKIGVVNHPTLKTEQLIQFIENQSNQFLLNDFPRSVTQDRFLTIFQNFKRQDSQDPTDYSQYVGLVLIYSSSSEESFQFMKKAIPDSQALADLFMIIVEMDNTDKKTNVVGDQGQRLCEKNGYQFSRLSLYNSQELVTILHKNLYQLIENYYYPNQQQKPSKKNEQPQYVFHYNQTTPQQVQSHLVSTTSNIVTTTSKVVPEKPPALAINTPVVAQKTNNNKNVSSPTMQQKQIIVQTPQKTTNKKQKQQKEKADKAERAQKAQKAQKARIIAVKQEKKSIQILLDKASQLRQSRHNQILQEQKQIDESIENVEKVLQKINQNINHKKRAQWYTSLNHTIYSPLQKNSVSFAKIKLTQEFLDDDQNSEEEGDFAKFSKIKSKMSMLSQKNNFKPQKSALINKFIAKHRKLQPLLKLLLTVSESVIVELDVYEESDYHDLTLLAIKKLGITQSPHNYKLMRKIISERIQDFIKELIRAVKNTEKIRIDERSFIRPNQNIKDYNSNGKSLYRSNVSGYSGRMQ